MPSAVDQMLDGVYEGDLIQFGYKQQSGNGRWYQWSATGIFIARQQGGNAPWPDTVVISFRPKAGTSQFNAAELVFVRRLKSLVERRAKGQVRADSRVRLPVKKTGAVPAP